MSEILTINHHNIGEAEAGTLIELCPFSAISYENGRLAVSDACTLCGLCVRMGPDGCMEMAEEEAPAVFDQQSWRGIAVFADTSPGYLHPVSLELLGKALELSKAPRQPVYALLCGEGLGEHAEQLIRYGADEVFVYEDPRLKHFVADRYADVMTHFVEAARPSSVLVGATGAGRSLAPRVAARLGTGLTADCTALEMRENTDLVQIRPAFGGNIMAQIVTHNHRPQFCTVRYKIFSMPQPMDAPTGVITKMEVPPLSGAVEVLSAEPKPTEMDISDAEVIVAAGRGAMTPAALGMVKELAEILGAQLACTRPLSEYGLFDPKRQIGLSGRTVKPKLIITAGISGSVQFAAGMKGAECIVAINKDPDAQIFGVAHVGFVGDVNEILPRLIEKIKEGRS